jgi:serine protease inhibitor
MLSPLHTLLAPLMIASGHPSAAADTAPGYLHFGFELLHRRVAAAPADNVSLSPVSAGFALGAAALGARGPTQSQMFVTLGFAAGTPNSVAQANKQWIAALRGQKDVELEIANAVWLDRMFVVDSSYARRMASAFHADITSAPLRTPAGVAQVNRWVAQHTHNRIDKILDQPRDNSAAFIANATYFKGRWAKEFAKNATRAEPFYAATGSAGKVPTMHARLDATYARAGDVQLARLPYRGDRFEMVVVLPDSGVPATDIANQLSDSLWQQWIGQTKSAELDLALPRFKLETDMSLGPDLKALGMPQAFDQETADFSPMFAEPIQRTFISEVRQKTWIAVDEAGTEAAAVTGVTVGVTSARVDRPIPFVVNRPFLYALRDTQTGLVLFLGLVRQPQPA